MPNTSLTPVMIYMTPEQAEAFRRFAKMAGMSKAEIARNALAEYFWMHDQSWPTDTIQNGGWRGGSKEIVNSDDST